MKKEFNDTGHCVDNRHYMVDITNKIEPIIALIKNEKYFAINRPRQFGKTTLLSCLARQMNRMDNYLALNISFEAIESDAYIKQEYFINTFLDMLASEFHYLNHPTLSAFVEKNMDTIKRMSDLSKFITNLVRNMMPGKFLVLLIDEIDKSGNNQLFLDFLGMLRHKFLKRNEGRDFTFQSVILAGVHDIKNLKGKIRSDNDQKFNSPWNIAIDFTIDLSFDVNDIKTMLNSYARDKNISFDTTGIAEKIYYYTSGYPYLVSKLCKFIDEQIAPQNGTRTWSIHDVDTAFNLIVSDGYSTTLFDSLTKYLETNQKLYNLISRISIDGAIFPFTITNPVINIGHLYGFLSASHTGCCQIHNRIFEQRIYSHIMSNILQNVNHQISSFSEPEYYTNEGLDINLILNRFQIFMKEHSAQKDEIFLEREGRLLFLSFLRPIINGRGFEFKEPNVSHERRMDIVITYLNQRYVIELKIWRGIKYHQEGLKQLSDYLDIYSLKNGALLIFNFNKNKEYKQENIVIDGKHVYIVWV